MKNGLKVVSAELIMEMTDVSPSGANWMVLKQVSPGQFHPGLPQVWHKPTEKEMRS